MRCKKKSWPRLDKYLHTKEPNLHLSSHPRRSITPRERFCVSRDAIRTDTLKPSRSPNPIYGAGKRTVDLDSIVATLAPHPSDGRAQNSCEAKRHRNRCNLLILRDNCLPTASNSSFAGPK